MRNSISHRDSLTASVPYSRRRLSSMMIRESVHLNEDTIRSGMSQFPDLMKGGFPAGKGSTPLKSSSSNARIINCDVINAKPLTVQLVRKQHMEEAIQLKQRQLFLSSTSRNTSRDNTPMKARPLQNVGSQSHRNIFSGAPQSTHNLKVQATPKFDRILSKAKEEDFNDMVKSSVDSELFSTQSIYPFILLINSCDSVSLIHIQLICFSEYRFQNPRAMDIQRKESIQSFIYDKKYQNKLKYSDRSKINTTALPVPQGSISVMLNVQKKDYGFNLSHFKTKIPSKSKFKMKWKTIQWLLQAKQDVIKQLFSNYHLMLKFAKNKKEGMDRHEFGELLSYVGLGAEKNLGDKLFYIFDDDNSGTVDYKELIIGLEMFKENTIIEKLKVFIDLCDRDDDGLISPEELYNILKQNIFNTDDKVKLKGIIKQIYKDHDTGGEGVLQKDELYQATQTSVPLLGLLAESVRCIKRIDQIIESDLEDPLQQFIPVSSNSSSYKEGIHFKLVDRMLNVIEEAENFRKDSRKQFKDALSLGKSKKEIELLKQDSLNLSHIDE